MTKWMHMRSTS